MTLLLPSCLSGVLKKDMIKGFNKSFFLIDFYKKIIYNIFRKLRKGLISMKNHRAEEAYNHVQEVIDFLDSLAFTGAIFENEADDMISKLLFTQIVLKED